MVGYVVCTTAPCGAGLARLRGAPMTVLLHPVHPAPTSAPALDVPRRRHGLRAAWRALGDPEVADLRLRALLEQLPDTHWDL